MTAFDFNMNCEVPSLLTNLVKDLATTNLNHNKEPCEINNKFIIVKDNTQYLKFICYLNNIPTEVQVLINNRYEVTWSFHLDNHPYTFALSLSNFLFPFLTYSVNIIVIILKQNYNN